MSRTFLLGQIINDRLNHDRPPSRLLVSLAILVMYVTVSDALQSKITYTQIGKRATFNCTYDAEEKPVTMYIFKDGALFFFCDLTYTSSACTRIEQTSNTFEMTSTEINAVSFSTPKVRCEDQGLFVCKSVHLPAQTSVFIYKQSAVRLNMTECTQSSGDSSHVTHSETSTHSNVTNTSHIKHNGQSQTVNYIILAIVAILLILGGLIVIRLYKGSLCNRANSVQHTEPSANDIMDIDNIGLQPMCEELVHHLLANDTEPVDSEHNESTSIHVQSLGNLSAAAVETINFQPEQKAAVNTCTNNEYAIPSSIIKKNQPINYKVEKKADVISNDYEIPSSIIKENSYENVVVISTSKNLSN